jgi:hypothetical protein
MRKHGFKDVTLWASFWVLLAPGLFLSRSLESPNFQVEAIASEDLSLWSNHSGMSETEIKNVFQRYLIGLSDPDARSLARTLSKLCQEFKFDPAFILSVIRAESQFRTHAISHAGAIGLMQLMPRTARYVADRWDVDSYESDATLFEPETNMRLGVTYLAYLRDRYQGRLPMVLAAYNFGPGVIDRMVAQKRTYSQKTKNYVQKIVRGAIELRSQGSFGPERRAKEA